MSYKGESFTFIADVMLGKLAKWLRILGFDVLYNRNFADEDVLKTALSENRVILTKDKKLSNHAKKLSINCVFIDENDCFSQLKNLIKILNLKKSDVSLFIRCVKCNSLIKQIRREEVEGLVPDFIYNTFLVFSKCEGCGKIYWKGSHKVKIEKILNRIFEK